jgi:hypothetical protein
MHSAGGVEPLASHTGAWATFDPNFRQHTGFSKIDSADVKILRLHVVKRSHYQRFRRNSP